MADAYQTRAQLVTDFANNTSGAITAQQLRDFVYSSIILDTSGNLDIGTATGFIFPSSIALNLNSNNLTNGGTLSFDSGDITSNGSGALTITGALSTDSAALTTDGSGNLSIVSLLIPTFASIGASGAASFAGGAATVSAAGAIAGLSVAGNTAILGTFIVDANGSRGVIVSAYAAGTVYTLTNAAAAVVFGTTSPTITLATAGKYRIRAQVVVELVGATFAANQALTIKLRRTNNTAGDLTNSTLVYTVPIVTTLTNTLAVITLPDVFYTTAGTSDVVTIFAGLAATPSAGSVTISAASIIAADNY